MYKYLLAAILLLSSGSWAQNEHLDAQETRQSLIELYQQATRAEQCGWEVNVAFSGAVARVNKTPKVIKNIPGVIAQAMQQQGKQLPTDAVYVWDWDQFTAAEQDLIATVIWRGYEKLDAMIMENHGQMVAAEDFMQEYHTECMSKKVI